MGLSLNVLLTLFHYDDSLADPSISCSGLNTDVGAYSPSPSQPLLPLASTDSHSRIPARICFSVVGQDPNHPSIHGLVVFQWLVNIELIWHGAIPHGLRLLWFALRSAFKVLR